jgi:DNA-binding transcriptional LysR family regulator
MDLNEILVFARVVQAGSFTGAARELEMPKSTVSRKVSDLEERLGARLLQRTTRKLSLTDVGRTYYQHAVRVAAEVEEAELAVTQMQEVPRGLLRVTAPLNVGYLGAIVA